METQSYAAYHNRIYRWAKGVMNDWKNNKGGFWENRPRFKYLDNEGELAHPVRRAVEEFGYDWKDFRKSSPKWYRNGSKQKDPRRFGPVNNKQSLPRMNVQGEIRQSKCATSKRCFVCEKPLSGKVLTNNEYSVPGIPLRVHAECKDQLAEKIQEFIDP